MPSEMKADLMKRAEETGRSLTSEINFRLRDSLARELETLANNVNHVLLHEQRPGGRMGMPVTSFEISEGSKSMERALFGKPSPDEHAIEQKLMTLFRRLPFEKQLALLSLIN